MKQSREEYSDHHHHHYPHQQQHQHLHGYRRRHCWCWCRRRRWLQWRRGGSHVVAILVILGLLVVVLVPARHYPYYYVDVFSPFSPPPHPPHSVGITNSNGTVSIRESNISNSYISTSIDSRKRQSLLTEQQLNEEQQKQQHWSTTTTPTATKTMMPKPNSFSLHKQVVACNQSNTWHASIPIAVNSTTWQQQRQQQQHYYTNPPLRLDHMMIPQFKSRFEFLHLAKYQVTEMDVTCFYQNQEGGGNNHHLAHVMQQLYRCMSLFLMDEEQKKEEEHRLSHHHPRHRRRRRILAVPLEFYAKFATQPKSPQQRKYKGRNNFVAGFVAAMQLDFHVILQPVKTKLNSSHLVPNNNNKNNNNTIQTSSSLLLSSLQFVTPTGYDFLTSDAQIMARRIIISGNNYAAAKKKKQTATTTTTTRNSSCSCSSPTTINIGILNRQKSRRLVNAQQLATALLTMLPNTSLSSPQLWQVQVELMQFEKTSFWQQITFLSCMDILISPHGAQLTGLPFLGQACRGCCLAETSGHTDFINTTPSNSSNNNCTNQNQQHHYCQRPAPVVVEIFPEGYCFPQFFGSLAINSGLQHYYVSLSSFNTENDSSSNRNLSTTCRAPSLIFEQRQAARAQSLCPCISQLVYQIRHIIVTYNNHLLESSTISRTTGQ